MSRAIIIECDDESPCLTTVAAFLEDNAGALPDGDEAALLALADGDCLRLGGGATPVVYVTAL